MPKDVIVAEIYLFDTCTHRCGYCTLAEDGSVLDTAQIDRFRDPAFIDRFTAFFNSRTIPERRWLVQFTGGEPLLMPNLDRLCDGLIDAGNRVAFYTALLLDENHASFKYLMSRAAPGVDYIMGSFHPESEADEDRQFAKFVRLKERGHNVIFRYVGHPARLGRLEHFAERCRQADICFYPTTLFSTRFPAAYTEPERQALKRFFTSTSQFVQLHGGVETTGVQCHAGSRMISIHMKTGNITPCITVSGPILGNLFNDELRMESGPIICPEQGIACPCDVHFQQEIVIGVPDADRFSDQKRGFVDPAPFQGTFFDERRRGFAGSGIHLYDEFHVGAGVGIGMVENDMKLTFSKQEVKARWVASPRRFPVPGVTVELRPDRSIRRGEVITVEVRPDLSAPVEAVQGFVNEAPNGTVKGSWRMLPTIRAWDGSSTSFAVDTATLAPGPHRLGINLHLAGGGVVSWHDQPARMCDVVEHELEGARR